MAYVPLTPAEPAFAADGTPFAPAYGDVFHSRDGGPAQARHVFLAGNGLPQRWQRDRSFVILETGFGLGLNFLVTRHAWRGTPGRRLHYVAVEKHPFATEDLVRLHARWPDLTIESRELLTQWPPLLPGLHRLDFGDVALTLAFGDAVDLLPQLRLAADAFYLDGFAPEKNPALWSAAVTGELRRLAAPGATLATWTVAGEVRRHLTAAGFTVVKQTGFGGKREMLAGCFDGRAPEPMPAPRQVAVIGAGIAGAAAVAALARRGIAATVFESSPRPAQGASGNLAGVVRPLPAMDDGRLARLLRAGFLLGRRAYAEHSHVRQGWAGVLHIARDARHESMQRRLVLDHRLPSGYCRFVERDEASRLSGWPVALGGWWFPTAGWINPPDLCHALLAGSELRCGQSVRVLQHGDAGWQLVGTDGTVLATTDAVVVANGVGARDLLPMHHLGIRTGRGVVSHLPAEVTPPLDVVCTRVGYVTPAVGGLRCAGATLSADDADTAPRATDHAENLHRLEMILPGYAKGIDPATLAGRGGLRPLSPDRLPLCGGFSGPPGLWLLDGFGARGLVFAPICAELLASQLSGDPLPLEADLAIAMKPERFRPRRRAVAPAPTL